MKSRSLAALMAGVLAMSGLTACSQPASGPSTLVIQRSAADHLPENNPIETALEEKIGTSIDMTTLPGGEYYTQLTAAMAGGNAPDLFTVDRAHLQQFVQQGQILDLTDYLSSGRLDDYRAAVDKDAFPLAELDGKTYATVTRPSFNYNSYWIRADWLEELGLSAPTTVEDLLTVAKAFRQDDPDKSGQDTYGVTGGKSGALWSPLWGAFGSAGLTDYGANGGSFSIRDGAVVNSLQDPNTASALAFIRKLIEADVVDPDYLSVDDLQAHERAMQGKAGIVFTEWPKMTKPEFVEQYKKINPDARWVQLGPLTGPKGVGAIPRNDPAGGMWAISAAVAKDDNKLQKIFDLLNYVSTQEGNRLVSYGIEGQHYTSEGGKVVGTELLDKEGGYFWLYQFTGRDEEEYLQTKFPKQQKYIEFAAEFPQQPTLGNLVLRPDDYNLGDAGAFAQEQVVQFVTGERPLSEYDAFLAELDTTFGQGAYVEDATRQLRELGMIE